VPDNGAAVPGGPRRTSWPTGSPPDSF